jgi:RNA polymerase sigma factor (sigma-70 family)
MHTVAYRDQEGADQRRHAVDLALVDPTRRERLVRLCCRLASDRTLAEDLAQESLLEGWRHRERVVDVEGIDRWLAAIARNVCLRSDRRTGREAALLKVLTATSTDEDTSDDGPHQAVERGDLAAVVARALDELPEPARDLLRRRHGEEMPIPVIAEQLGLSSDAVSMRLTRARALLRRRIEQDHRKDVVAYGLVPDEAGEWQPTRVWCTECGVRMVQMRRAPEEISFRCPGCDPCGEPSCVLPLANPSFAGLVGSLSRPAPMLTRLRSWTDVYYRQGIERGGAACTACGAAVTLRPYVRPEGTTRPSSRVGLAARCSACGTELSSSLQSLALALPGPREFLRRHRRIHSGPVEWLPGPVRQVAVVFERHDANGHIRVVMETGSLRVTEVTGTAAVA